MSLDAVIIAGSGTKSFSGTNPLKLSIDGHVADIQTVLNFVENNGEIIPPVNGSGEMSWASAPKLNGIYLLSYLNKHGFKTQLIDNFFNSRSTFASLMLKNPISVIISTTFITSYQTLVEMTNEIRSGWPKVKIIIGGPFIYTSYLIFKRSSEIDYLPEEAKNDYLFTSKQEAPDADLFIIDPRGEPILCEALKKAKQKKELYDLPNTAIFQDGNFKFSKRIDHIHSTDDLIEWDKLPDEIFKTGVVPLQASIGCPFNCAFCNFVKDRRITAVKPIDLLLSEMKQIRNRGAKYVWFVDDNFRLGRSDLEAVCKRFICEEIDLKWMTFIRASTLDMVDVELLKKSGCIEVQLGLESADDQILRNMNKKATSELYGRVLNKLLSIGINCSCYLIFGFPGETDESARRTIEFMRHHDSQDYKGLLSWSIFPFLLAPLSPIYEKDARLAHDLTGHMKNWKHTKMNYKKSMDYVMQAFFELKNSGPIYRDDNQYILGGLEYSKRRLFYSNRHSLAKKSLLSEITKGEFLVAFNKVFQTNESGGSQRLDSLTDALS